MISTKSVIDITEKWAPLQIAESWDNTGLQVGNPTGRVQGIILSLDVTREVLKKSTELKPALILTHHPLLFKPPETIISDTFLANALKILLTEGSTVYSAHTNLDNAPGGVSFALAGKLGLCNREVLKVSGNERMVKLTIFVPPEFTDKVRSAMADAGAGRIGEYSSCSFSLAGTGTFIPSYEAKPFTGSRGKLERVHEDRMEMILNRSLLPQVLSAARKTHPYEEMAYDVYSLENPANKFGTGCFGILPEGLAMNEFTALLKKVLKVNYLKAGGKKKRWIKKVAVCGGSGENLAEAAYQAGADVFVTGDISYHTYINMVDKTALVDATHRATELPVLSEWATRIERSLPETKGLIHVVHTPEKAAFV